MQRTYRSTRCAILSLWMTSGSLPAYTPKVSGVPSIPLGWPSRWSPPPLAESSRLTLALSIVGALFTAGELLVGRQLVEMLTAEGTDASADDLVPWLGCSWDCC